MRLHFKVLLIVVLQAGLILCITSVIVRAEARRENAPPAERRQLLLAPIDEGENRPPLGITGPIAGTVNSVQ